MVNRLLQCHLGKIKYDDRDSFLNKRVESSGELMAQLFRAYFGKFVKELKATCEKDMIAGRISELSQNLSKKLKPNSIENDIKYALGTGNWGLKIKLNPERVLRQFYNVLHILELFQICVELLHRLIRMVN